MNELGLPREAEEMVRRSEPRWKRALHAGFFSLRRRRKKGALYLLFFFGENCACKLMAVMVIDWNEVLKLYDQTCVYIRSLRLFTS